MGTILLLVAMTAPSSPGQFHGVQDPVAFELQRQAIEHFHIVGDPSGQSRLVGQAKTMYDLAVHPSSVGRARAPHPSLRIPSTVAYHHRPTHTPRGHAIRTTPKRPYQQDARVKAPTAAKRPDGATLAQAKARLRSLKALAKEAKRRNLPDIGGWLHAEAERLSQRIQFLQERREQSHPG